MKRLLLFLLALTLGLQPAMAQVVGTPTTLADGASNFNTGVGDSSGTVKGLWVTPYAFNGSTWDRQFTCTSTAAVSVTAAATTEIVALTAAQTIRVCAIALTMSTAGTAKFVYGSGTNCGTGTTDITAAMNLATATPLTISVAQGSVLRAASGKALCIAAVTGNVVGWISYAKF